MVASACSVSHAKTGEFLYELVLLSEQMWPPLPDTYLLYEYVAATTYTVIPWGCNKYRMIITCFCTIRVSLSITLLKLFHDFDVTFGKWSF